MAIASFSDKFTPQYNMSASDLPKAM